MGPSEQSEVSTLLSKTRRLSELSACLIHSTFPLSQKAECYA